MVSGAESKSIACTDLPLPRSPPLDPVPCPSSPLTRTPRHPEFPTLPSGSPGSGIKERSLAGTRDGCDGARARRSIDPGGTYLWRIATSPRLRSPPPSPVRSASLGAVGSPALHVLQKRAVEKGWGQRVATRARYPGSGLCRPLRPLRRLGSTANFANCWPRCIPMCHGYPHDGDGRRLPSAPRRRNPAARCRLPHSTVAALVRVLHPNPTATHAATAPGLADI